VTTTGESVEPRGCPYVGLDYYHEKFGAWFFGREDDGSKIITNMQAARLTLLHAESGVGKSSVLRAEVAWRLRRLAHAGSPFGGEVDIPVVFSSWKDDPVRALVRAIDTAIDPFLAGHPKPRLPADRLDAAIGVASDAVNASLLIMLDQFEEYFLYRAREPVPGRFADELARCINSSGLRANFLIAIREDAYAGLGDLFKGRIANIYSNYLHIEYLDRDSAERAIRAPLDVYNSQPGIPGCVTIQDALVQAVLHQVRAFDPDGVELQGPATAVNGAHGVATALLQLVMETIWEHERAEGSWELRLSTLQNLEGVEKIVDTHLGNALRSLSDDERQTAIDAFDHLVTPSGGKIAESVPDLARRTGHNEEQIGQVLEKLDRARIVRPVPAPPGQDSMRFRRYEIFHDVLAPAINRTVAASEEQRQARQLRLARRARWLRLFGVLGVCLLIVVSVVAVVFANLLQTATIERLVSESRELAADADVNATVDPEISVLLALQALHVRYTSQAEYALRAAIPQLQELRTLADGSAVFSAAFDPADANEVASADGSGVASIWDFKTGRPIARMSLGGFAVTGSADTVGFNPAGTEVAVGDGGGQVTLFDARSGRELQSATIPGSPLVDDVEFLGGTGELAIATQQGLELWRPQNGSRCCDILSSGLASAVTDDPSNPLEFAVTTDSGTVIWNMSGSGKPRQQRLPHGPWFSNDAAFSPGGSEVATADSDGNVRVYDLAASKVVMTLNAGEASAQSVAFSPDGTKVVAGYSSGRARVWDVSTGFQVTLLTGNGSGVVAVQFSPDGQEVVTGGEDGTIRLWRSLPAELRTEFPTSSVNGVSNRVLGVGYLSRDRIIALDSSGHLYVLTPSGARLAVISPHGTTVDSADWDSAGTELILGQANGTVGLWRAVGTGYSQVRFPSAVDLNDARAQDVSMTNDGSRILIVTNDGFTIKVLSTRTGRTLQTFSAAHPVSEAVFSPSGQIFANDNDGQVEAWNAVGQLRILGTTGPDSIDIEFNQSGSQFVTASLSGKVTVWATNDDRPPRAIDACSSPETASFSPDGTKIVVACGDGTVPVFNVVNGQLLAQLEASAGSVNAAAFSPDGTSIVTALSAGTSGAVQIWNSELATSSLPAIEHIAEQRITQQQLTPAERAEYLTGTG
jgi:WD40 repeat protein